MGRMTMHNTKDITIAILAAICAVLAFLNLIHPASRHAPRDGVFSDTVRVIAYDTIRIIKPLPRDSVVLRYITERLPIGRDTAHLIGEAGTLAPDTDAVVGHDSMEVAIPISSKEYRGDGYRAWVSGYRTSLDSIMVYPCRETVTVTNTTRQKPRRFGIGLNAGYGVTPHGLQPYIGIGIHCNLFSF